MPNKEVSIVLGNLLDALTQRPELRAARFSRKGLVALFSQCGFRGRLAQLLPHRPYEPAEVLSLCLPVMQNLCPDPPADWLFFIYDLLVERLFPSEGAKPAGPARLRASLFYLGVLQTLLRHEAETGSFAPDTHFRFATEEERAASPTNAQYATFLRLMDSEFLMELMRIGRAVKPFDMLSHVAGVHHIAVQTARQLIEAGVAVDIPLLSAAAATHDIGKYGCKGAQMQRIPYLHYYYTEEWLTRCGLSGIAHVAANHSTWDLELENLPVESLLLIYADFRVKSVRGAGGREEMRFYTLREAYDVILGKLDNVDDAKRRRYRRVYAKLADFEAYMCSLGVDPDPYAAGLRRPFHKDPALLFGEEAVEGLKFLTVSHNIRLMHKISSETSFADLLEKARTETDWQNIRTYMDLFEEYFTFMTQKQKLLTMRFLYELFMHTQGDIRFQAATLYGRILAGYDVVYRKELPPQITAVPPGHTALSLFEETLERILLPDHKIAPNHRAWINYTLKVLLPSLLLSCPAGDAAGYLTAYLRCFGEERYQEDSIAFVLLDSLLHVPHGLIAPERLMTPLTVAARLAASPEPRMQAAALRLALRVQERPDAACAADALQAVVDALPAEPDTAVAFLLHRVGERLPARQERRYPFPRFEIADVFLDNLKTATPWLIKEVNVDLLLCRAREEGDMHAFQIAAHYANLIRVSERFAVRRRAGESLLKLAGILTRDQRNEIAVDLTRALESASYEFAKYIPQYLGGFMLYLHPKELDETLGELGIYLKSANERAACVSLETLGALLVEFDRNPGAYPARFPEPPGAFEARRLRILSMIMGGLAHYSETVARTAFLVLGKRLFGAEMSYPQKCAMFLAVYKKLLTLISEQKPGTLAFFSNAASLNHIYRFLIESEADNPPLTFAPPDGVAFFPGTFDPFSASHLGIVRAIREMGLEVYLAIDEFSWSKHTQPHMVRRRIVNMSVAELFGVYLFPDDIPVNLANAADLAALRALFPGRALYIAAGSDVVRDASAYQAPPAEGSVHGFNHVLFLRGDEKASWRKERTLARARITGEIRELALPAELEDVSSSGVRESVDHNRDISAMVDPAVQGFIYDNGLYLREPQDKAMLRPESIAFECCGPENERMRGEFVRLAALQSGREKRGSDFSQSAENLEKLLQKPDARLMVLKQRVGRGAVRGAALFYSATTAELYEEFRDIRLAEYVRRHASGKIAVLAGVYGEPGAGREDAERLLLTETLAHCLGQDYTYALFIGANSPASADFYAMLERRGFLRLPDSVGSEPVYAVDMRSPVALIEDVRDRIKPPLAQDGEVQRVLRDAHERLSLAMAGLYPGRLVLSFQAEVLSHALIRKIMQANGVDGPLEPGAPGECMCVPYGKVLRSVLVPNTVTKGLHVEKTYAPDMKSFEILEYPGYAPLINQIRTIKSFNRPVLLVDDLLHKGYRLEALDPLFKRADLNVKQIIVGLMSGRGKDLMSVQGREADCVYFIPNLRYWFVESELYPFLGGDSVKRASGPRPYLLPSVNQILPYTFPSFISGTTNSALFALSLTCLNNALEILNTLQRGHQQLFGRNLTLQRLGEALHTPRVPDRGGCMRYDRVLSPGMYVENDIEMLLRLENILKQG